MRRGEGDGGGGGRGGSLSHQPWVAAPLWPQEDLIRGDKESEEVRGRILNPGFASPWPVGMLCPNEGGMPPD